MTNDVASMLAGNFIGGVDSYGDDTFDTMINDLSQANAQSSTDASDQSSSDSSDQTGTGNDQDTPQSLAAQVPDEVKEAIKDSVTASDHSSDAAGDKKGGFHEEGGVWGNNSSGNTVVIPALPGKVADPRVEKAHIDVLNSAKPELRNTLAPPGILGKWHVHPSGSISDEKGIHGFKQQPSGKKDDLANATFRINIVVGAADKKVYFYNSNGIIGKPMKLKDFLGN